LTSQLASNQLARKILCSNTKIIADKYLKLLKLNKKQI